MTHPGGRPRVSIDQRLCKTARDKVAAKEWTVTRAAGELGVSRRTVLRLIHGKHVSQKVRE